MTVLWEFFNKPLKEIIAVKPFILAVGIAHGTTVAFVLTPLRPV